MESSDHGLNGFKEIASSFKIFSQVFCPQLCKLTQSLIHSKAKMIPLKWFLQKQKSYLKYYYEHLQKAYNHQININILK